MKHILVAALAISAFHTAAASPPPNIVYIIADDHAWTDFGFMGNERVHTPNLDRLAAQSARFTNGYVPSSVCRPSLVSLLTGLYPHQHGVHFNHGPPGSAGYNRMTSADAYVKTRQREFEIIRKQKFAHTARSKRAPFDDGLRTPILIRWDGVIAPATWESPVSSIDLMPTLLAIADIAENHRPRLPGVDLLPVCRGQLKPDDNRPIFGEIYPGDATSLSNPSADIAYRWVRQANLKLIEPHKQANGSGPWGGHLQSTALFNVKADPFERHDLSSLAEYKQDVARLRTQLDRWWKPDE